MQPYFIPYAGYFRLFQSTDLFVVYDCVQFVRRGWLHRNKVTDSKNESSWLTLPFNKAPQDIKISDLTFAEDATERMQDLMRKFPLFNNKDFQQSEFKKRMLEFSQSPVNYITALLKLTCDLLEIPFNVVRSSELNIPSDLTGQDRIIALASHFKASHYINAPGGRELYDDATFKQHNIKLQFLSEYDGSYQSILPRLFNENISLIKNEITSQSIGV